MIPPCWYWVVPLWLILAVTVHAPEGAVRSTTFLAVLDVVYRSPAWVGIVTVPLLTTRLASRRITLQAEPSSLPLKSSRRTPGVQLAPNTVVRTVAEAVPPLPSETVTLAL